MSAKATVEPSRSAPSPGRALRVLVVDDHDAFRALLGGLLRSWGAVVMECRNGNEAVRAMSQSGADWVIMDVEMPVLDGFGATRQIVAANPKARVIILTQHDDADSREAAAQCGAVEFVPKDRLELLPGILFAV